ncbi:MAG: hypothetical protein JWQ35_2457 [Bacteriovoracaceae bacterium]|nr:hypothetical protein [Bacteriovoracaceae bacterium]
MKRIFQIVFSISFIFCALSFWNLSAEDTSVFHPAAVRKGFYTGMTTGRLFFTGNDRLLYKDGWVIGFKLGYDIWKYLGLETDFKLSGQPSTEGSIVANVPKSFFVYQYIAQLKGGYPITQRLYAEAGIGGGLFIGSPNMNRTVSATRSMFYAEMGLEYFMRTRGISIGLDPSIAGVANLQGAVIQTTGFVRYTF